MNKRCRYILFLVVVPLLSFSQVNDVGLWVSANLQKKLSSKISFAFSEEVRMNENISEAAAVFTDVSAEIKLVKRLTISPGYRFIQKRKLDDSYGQRHRAYIDLAYRHKFKALTLTLRERFQSQYNEINRSEYGSVPLYYLRTKLTAKYDLKKKATPFISFELFYPVSTLRQNEFDNYRAALGFNYKINKHHDVDLSYLLNKELNLNDPLTEYVTGISYTYSF